MRFGQHLASAFLVAATTLLAEEGRTADSLTFEKDIRPILKSQCFHCHGEAGELEGGLDLRLRHLIAKGGDQGPSIVPGKPEESILFTMIRDGEMPKSERKLSAEQQDVIRRWIASGAPVAREEPTTPLAQTAFTPEERSHWAFQPIRRPELPRVEQFVFRHWPDYPVKALHPIDAFIAQRLIPKKLALSPPADRATLIRRACFDLLGLPPKPEEVDAFVNDSSPDAYEKLLDRLLDSPQYGERWGRHWLDVAGYADSEGYNDADTPRDDAWRYRDYVIRAFNTNKPFDQFIREQLAGDEMTPLPYRNLPSDAIDNLIATGFLRMAPDGTGVKNDDQDLARNAVVSETVKIVSSSLLGLTVGCAQCHDHRFDPISQQDYYRLRAIFEPALNWKNWREPHLRRISVLTDSELARAATLEKEARSVEAEYKSASVAMREEVFQAEVNALPPEIREAGKNAGQQWYVDEKKLTPEQLALLADYPRLKVPASSYELGLFLNIRFGPDREKQFRATIDGITNRAAVIRKQKPPEQYIRALTEVPGEVPSTHVFRRGDIRQPEGSVKPGDLSVLGSTPVEFALDDSTLPTTGRRLAFARHLTNASHPLLPRVLVNRFWMHHFGRGLVETPSDFGVQGTRPTHPELLDWLASEFLASGWDLKAHHRLIMTSAAYRQHSARNEVGEQADSGNALLWRMNVRRLEAETIRDAILSVTGKLNLSAFGPPTKVMEDENRQVVVGGSDNQKDHGQFRRSIYVQVRRSQPAYLLNVFDAPKMEPNCDVRNSSTVSTQSLLLMNSRFLVEQSQFFAMRAIKEAEGDRERQIRLAWRLAYGAAIPNSELVVLSDYFDQQKKLLAARLETKDSSDLQSLASLCQILLGSNRFLYID